MRNELQRVERKVVTEPLFRIRLSFLDRLDRNSARTTRIATRVGRRSYRGGKRDERNNYVLSEKAISGSGSATNSERGSRAYGAW